MLAIPEEPSDMRLWGTSPSSSRDFFCTGFFEYTPPCIEDEIAAEVECGHDEGYWYSESTSAATSCTASVASSEFSDDALIDIEDDDLDPLLPITLGANFHLPSLENKLKDTCTKSSREDKRQRARSSMGASETLSSNKRRRRKESPHRQSRKVHECLCQRLDGQMEQLSWSEMSSDEQVEAVEYITRVVSTTLGLREQLDIIRIISPDAMVLPSDTEFVIDLDSFNDNKFQRIKQFVRQCLPQESCPLCSESGLNNSRQSSDSQHRKHSKRKSKKTLGTKHISQKSKKHKGVLGRVHKQMLKERKSGLFENEQVISINQAEEKEEEFDIDILS